MTMMWPSAINASTAAAVTVSSRFMLARGNARRHRAGVKTKGSHGKCGQKLAVVEGGKKESAGGGRRELEEGEMGELEKGPTGRSNERAATNGKSNHQEQPTRWDWILDQRGKHTPQPDQR